MSAMSANSSSIPLTGIDGTNPLGFLAALGTLVVARASGESGARLRWERARTWMPVLVDLSDKTRLCERLADNLQGRSVSGDAVRQLDAAEKAYKQAITAIKKETEKVKAEQPRGQERKAAMLERVAPLEQAAAVRRAEWLEALRDAVPRPELALGARIDCTAGEFRDHGRTFLAAEGGHAREAAFLLAAFGSDACLKDEAGPPHGQRIEATPFCFIRGSGHQDFLDTVRKLLSKVTAERVAEALFEPWSYRDDGLSMRWDPSEDKRYALTDVKPADEGARTVWMANLLAYRALVFFPCAVTSRGLGTTAWRNVDGEMVFEWPIWEFAAAPDVVRTMLQLGEPTDGHRRAWLSARGIAAVFRARRIRFPPKGSSFKLNFSPARQIL